MEENNKKEVSDYEKAKIRLNHPISLEEYNKDYYFNLNVTFMFIILINAIFIIGLFHNFSSDPDNIWFQRSGSLIVLCALISEYFHMSIKENLNSVLIKFNDGEISTMYDRLIKISYPVKPIDESFSFIFAGPIFFYIILGTFIWGYGDLLYSFFSNAFYFLLTLPFLFIFLIIIKRFISKKFSS